MDGDLNSCLSKVTLLPIASTIPYSTPELSRICCVTLIREKTRPRVADVCVRNLIDTNIDTLPWSAIFTVNNPIEHSWDHLDRRTCHKQLRSFLSKSGILASGNHQPIGYFGATMYSGNAWLWEVNTLHINRVKCFCLVLTRDCRYK